MRLLIAALGCVVLGCAGASVNAPLTAFRPSDAALFDNAVDLRTPAPGEGEGGLLDARVRRADLVAAVRVRSLSSELIKRRSAYRLKLGVEDQLKGTSTGEVVVRVTDAEPGYRTVEVNEDRLLHGSFIAFIKWEIRPDSTDLIPHWHISVDSEPVREQIGTLLRRSGFDPGTEVEVIED